MNVLMVFQVLYVRHCCFIFDETAGFSAKAINDEEAIEVLENAEIFLIPDFDENYDFSFEDYQKYFSCLYIFVKLVKDEIEEIIDILLEDRGNFSIKKELLEYFSSEKNTCYKLLTYRDPKEIERFINTHFMFFSNAFVDIIFHYVLANDSSPCLYDERFDFIVERMLGKFNRMRGVFEETINSENNLNVVQSTIDRIIYLFNEKLKIGSSN